MALTDDDKSIAIVGHAILDAVVDGYAAKGRDLPSRRYLTLGTPAVDCEQLVVSFQQIYLGVPGDEASSPQQCGGPSTGVFVVQLSRKVPVGTDSGPPSKEKIDSASVELLYDMRLLFDIVSNYDHYGMGIIVTGDVVEVAGGYGTIQIQTAMAV